MTKQGMEGLGRGREGGGGTPSPSPSLGCPIMLSVGRGINPWRGPGTSLLALSSVLVTFVCLLGLSCREQRWVP